MELGVVASCEEPLPAPVVTNDLISTRSTEFEFFGIENIELYPDNIVKIYNRWGRLVYEVNGYDNASNVFNGTSNADVLFQGSEKLPSGVYYYVIQFNDANGNAANLNGYLYLED